MADTQQDIDKDEELELERVYGQCKDVIEV